MNENDLLSGFVISIISVLIGFILAIGWDFYKFGRESKKKDDAVFFAVKHEQNKNLDILKKNIKSLEGEIKNLDKNSVPFNIINSLYSKSLEFLILNFPERLLKNKELIGMIMTATEVITRINMMIIVRDNHRVINFKMGQDSSYLQAWKHYDEILLEDSKSLLEELEFILEG